MISVQQPEGHHSAALAGLELLALPGLALAVIFEQLPKHWRGALRASCKQLQQVADALVLQHVMIGRWDAQILSGEGDAGMPMFLREANSLYAVKHVSIVGSLRPLFILRPLKTLAGSKKP